MPTFLFTMPWNEAWCTCQHVIDRPTIAFGWVKRGVEQPNPEHADAEPGTVQKEAKPALRARRLQHKKAMSVFDSDRQLEVAPPPPLGECSGDRHLQLSGRAFFLGRQRCSVERAGVENSVCAQWWFAIWKKPSPLAISGVGAGGGRWVPDLIGRCRQPRGRP